MSFILRSIPSRAACMALAAFLVASCSGGETSPAPVELPSASRSTVVVTPVSGVADGTTPLVVMVTVRDASGLPLSHRVVQLAFSGVGALDASSRLTDGSGEAQFNLTASSPTSGVVIARVISSGGTVEIADRPTATFTAVMHRLGGAIDGLLGSGLALATPGEPVLDLDSGATSFSFAEELAEGAPFAVRVVEQPTGPWQTCTVWGGSGVVGSEDVAGVRVSCETNAYSLGGVVSGLTTGGLVLAAASEPDLVVAAGSTGFMFALPVTSGTPYSVVVRHQPVAATCTTSRGEGEVAGDSITEVAIECALNAYRLGGTIVGLAGEGLALGSQGEPRLDVPAGALTFTFADPLFHGDAYAVTVVQQPTNPQQICSVSNGGGSVLDADPAGVTVTCRNSVTLGGAIVGLEADGLVLASPGLPNLSVGDGALEFTFANSLPMGSAYSVSILRQPAGHVCQVLRGDGTATEDVHDVSITCVQRLYRLGGTVAGLSRDGLVLAAAGQPDLAIGAGATTFAFESPVESGRNYSVSIKQQPAGDAPCTIVNSAGAVHLVDIADVEVVCQSPWSQVAGGRAHTLGLRPDGTLWAWGWNGSGELGDGTRDWSSRPLLVAAGFSFIAAGEYSSAAVKQDGTLWAWGSPYGDPEQVGSGFSSVAVGYCSFAALRADGTLWAWGCNSRGEVGDGTNRYRGSPVQVGTAADWASVVMGGSHTLAIKRDGSLWFWGDDDVTQSLTPVQVGTGFAIAAAGLQHSLALKSDGTLWAWGLNSHGEVGDGTFGSRATPSMVGSGFTDVAAGEGFSLGVRADGTLWIWGRDPSSWLGHGGTSVPIQVGASSAWASVAAGSSHATALTSGDALWTWGSDEGGQLGDGVPIGRPVPTQVLGGAETLATVNGSSEFAVGVDGSLWAWGSGELGDGTIIELQSLPVQVGSGYAQVANGWDHTVGVRSDGTVWAWGSNDFGQLGDGTTTDSLTPVFVGSGFTAVAAGDGFSVGLKSDGTVWAWGRNGQNEVGDGTGTTRLSPVLVGSGFVAVSAGESHTMGLKSDGSLWGWGANQFGQLGVGTQGGAASPRQVGSGFQAVAAGGRHTVAVRADGALWAWGENQDGEVGDGTHVNRQSPVVIGTGFVSVAAGQRHTVAVATDGSVWAWGCNQLGEVGDGTYVERDAPVRIIGGAFVAIATGRENTFALDVTGVLYAWGDNTLGQLGDGTSAFRRAPVPIP